MSPCLLVSSFLPKEICLFFRTNRIQLEKLGLQNVTFSCLRPVNDLMFPFLSIHPIRANMRLDSADRFTAVEFAFLVV